MSASTVRRRSLDMDRASQLAELFKALADSTRLRLLVALLDGELCVHDLTALVEVEQSAVSHQLRLLRDRGLARCRRQGRHVYYALADAHVRSLVEYGLEHVLHSGPERRSRGAKKTAVRRRR